MMADASLPGIHEPAKDSAVVTSRDQLWQHLAASLLTLVDLLAPKLDEKNLSLLRDFIDNREYGVALEWLASLIKTHSIQISSEQQQEIHRLAKIMRLSLDG
jgi:hypothetical protein